MAHRDPAATAAGHGLLHALPDLALAHIVSLLAPPEVFSFSSCCKFLRDACLAHVTTLTLRWRDGNDVSLFAEEGTVERWQQRAALLSLRRRMHSLKCLELISSEYLSMFGDVLRAGWGRTIEAIAVQDEMYDLSDDHYTVIGCSMEAGALPMLKSLEFGPIPEAMFHHLTDSLSKGPCANLTSLTLSITETSMITMLTEALEARARHSTRRCEPLRELTICCAERYWGEGVDRLFVASTVCDDLRELALHEIGSLEFLASYLMGVSSLEYLEVEGYTADHEVDPGPDASPMFRALSNGAAPKIQSLLLERCHVNTQCAQHLYSAVRRLDALHHLRYLSLADVFEVQSKMESFFIALAGLCPPCRGCPHLQTIEFDHNGGNGACEAVARCLLNLAFPRLQELVIHAHKVRDTEILALAEASLRRVKAVRYRSTGAYADPCKALTRVVVSRQSGGVMHTKNQQRLATLVERGAFRGVKELQLPVYMGCVGLGL